MKQSRTRVEQPVLSRSQELYAPRRSRTVKTVAWSLLWAASAWAISNIAGIGVLGQTLVACAGVLGVVAMGIAAHRHWKAHEVTPTQLRAAVAAALPGVELPRGSVKATGYQFGGVLNPTAPRKVIIRAIPGQPPLPDLNHDPKVRQKVVSLVAVTAGATYRIEEKKTKPGRRIVFSRYVVEAEKDDLTEAEKVERRFSKAAIELLGEGTSTRFTWEKSPENEEHLSEILVTAADGKQLALANKKKTTIAQLRTRLPGTDFNVQVDPQSDQILFKRKVPLPSFVAPPADHAALVKDHAAYKAFKVPLGVGDSGEEAFWQPSKSPHCMVVGPTGTGKTIVLHGIIQAFCQAGWRVWIIDGKRIEFLGYENYPNVEFLGQRLDDQIRLAEQAHTIMAQRMELIRTRQVTVEDLDPILVAVDELASFRDFIEERWSEVKGRTKGATGKAQTMSHLGNVARLARSLKVHLLYGLQRPDVEFVGGEARDNFSARVSMGAMNSGDASLMMWGNTAIGRQVPDWPGRGIGQIKGVPTQVQYTYTANPEPTSPDYHAGMVAAQRPQQTFHTQKRVADAVASNDEVGVTWDDILQAPVLDPEGNEIEFDPVSSPESRAMRKLRGSSAAPDRKLRVTPSMDEGLALFPVPRGNVTPVDPVDLLVTAVQESPFMPSHDPTMKNVKRAAAKRSREQVPAHSVPSFGETSPAFELEESSFAEGSEGESYPATAVEVRPDHRLICEELPEEILVGEVLPTEAGTGVVITGYTDAGVEHVIELENEESVLIGEDPNGD